MERNTGVLTEGVPLSGFSPLPLGANEVLWQSVSRETGFPFARASKEGSGTKRQRTVSGLWPVALDADGLGAAGLGLSKNLGANPAKNPGTKTLERCSCFPERLPALIVLHWGMGR